MQNLLLKDIVITPVYVPKSKKKHRIRVEQEAKDLCTKMNLDFDETILNYILANKLITPTGELYIPNSVRKIVRDQLLEIYKKQKNSSFNFDIAIRDLNPWISEYIEKFLKDFSFVYDINILPLIQNELQDYQEFTNSDIERFKFRTAFYEFQILQNLSNLDCDYSLIFKVFDEIIETMKEYYKDLYDTPISEKREVDKKREDLGKVLQSNYEILSKSEEVKKLFNVSISPISYVLNFSYSKLSKDNVQLHKLYAAFFQLITISRIFLWNNKKNIEEFLLFSTYVHKIPQEEFQERIRDFYDFTFFELSETLTTETLLNLSSPSFKLEKFDYDLLIASAKAFMISHYSRECFKLLNKKANNISKEQKS